MEDTIKLIHGDCLEELKNIPDKSINLVVMDPPYNISKEKEWDKWKTKEEYVEFMGKIFIECQRVLKDNGSMYFFHNDIPQISMLIEWLRNNTNFMYNSFIVLDKYNFRTKNWKNPTDKNNLRSWFNTCEYLLYYVKGDCLHTEWNKTGWDKVRLDVNNFKSLRKYAYEMMCYIGGANQQVLNTLKNNFDIEKNNTFSILGKRKIKQNLKYLWGGIDHFTRYGSTQWSLPTKETYEELTEKFNLREWKDYREYESLRLEYESLRLEYESLRLEYESHRFTHNLDKNHNNIFKFKRDSGKNYHSCQKPINILERIIQCSSNENEVVLDCFMGSGSTGVAAKHLNRKFIGIEKDDTYFNIAKQRIQEE